jgi:SAM-dependent methyltransferase
MAHAVLWSGSKQKLTTAGDIYVHADVIKRYQPSAGLFPVEQLLFARHIESGSRVLDLGVGAGRTTGALLPTSSKYVGLDVVDEMVAVARDHFPDADLRVGDAAALDAFDDETFDAVVFSFNGMDHLSAEDRNRCLAECARVLRDDGVLIVSRHNARSVVPARSVARSPGRGLRMKRAIRWFAACGALAVTRVPTRAFMVGHGTFHDGTHGGMRLACAIPKRAVDEMETHPFRVVDGPYGYQPDDPFQWWRTPWYYVVAHRSAR